MNKAFERTCAGCHKKMNKKDLIRIAKNDNKLSIDLSQKEDGRGVYICKNIECLEKTIKNKGLEKSLKCKCDNNIYIKLRSVILGK